MRDLAIIRRAPGRDVELLCLDEAATELAPCGWDADLLEVRGRLRDAGPKDVLDGRLPGLVIAIHDGAGFEASASSGLEVTDGGPVTLLFEDGFESGDVSAWSGGGRSRTRCALSVPARLRLDRDRVVTAARWLTSTRRRGGLWTGPGVW